MFTSKYIEPSWYDRTGVYGFARSYSIGSNETKADYKSLPPYFFRGSLGSQGVGTEGCREISQASTDDINEEFELILVLEKELGELQVSGFTFGFDITNLTKFKQDPAHIMWSKSISSLIFPKYFRLASPDELINTCKINVQKEGGGMLEQYQMKHGLQHCRVPIAEVSRVVEKFAGVECFDRILLFTGAAPGFALRDGYSSPKPGDTIKASVLSLELNLKVKFYQEKSLRGGCFEPSGC